MTHWRRPPVLDQPTTQDNILLAASVAAIFLAFIALWLYSLGIID